MKYIKKYESFKKQNSEPVNEEFLGKLIGGIKNLFKKAQERINKTKGGKEVEAIYQKYLTMITTELAKTAQVDLNVAAASKGDLPAGAAPGAAAPKTNDANVKLAVDTLKKKKAVMDQIVQRIKANALKEMDAILTKFGGVAANPQLKIIIDTKKDQFEMDYLNAQIAYLDKAGDKTMIAAVTKQRDEISKKIEGEFKEFDTAKAVEYAVGDEVIYLLKDKKPEEYDKTKKPEDQKAIVGVHKIVELDGDDFTLEDEKGEPTIKKTGKEIMGKVDAGEGEAAAEYKVGDNVIHLKGTDGNAIIIKKNTFDYNALSDEEKKNLDEGEAAKLVGVHKIEKIEGDKYFFKDKEGKEFTKIKDEIIGKSDEEVGEKAEGQEDLVKKLGDMKTNKPEDIKKVSSYVDFIGKEENKAKVEEIEKIIGGGAQEAQ
jgi:hypothetical protein